MTGQVNHQKLHLVGQDAAVAQDEVLPQAGHIRGVHQGHARLLGRAVALAVVAAPAGGDHVHPAVQPALAHGPDVLAGEVLIGKMVATVGAQVAVAGKQLAVGDGGAQIERVDVGHTVGADDGVDRDQRLLAGDGVVSAMEHRHLHAHFPAHLIGCVVKHSLFEADPGLRQPLTREFQHLQDDLRATAQTNPTESPHAAQCACLPPSNRHARRQSHAENRMCQYTPVS